MAKKAKDQKFVTQAELGAVEARVARLERALGPLLDIDDPEVWAPFEAFLAEMEAQR